MSFRSWARAIDADYGIPRPADESDLDDFQAGVRLTKDVFAVLSMLLCGIVSAWLIWRSAEVLLITSPKALLIVIAVCALVSMLSVGEAASVFLPYSRLSQRTTHGRARFLETGEAVEQGFAARRDKALPEEGIRLGRLNRKYDLFLPRPLCQNNIGICGPKNSGKSKTFMVQQLVDWSPFGSAVVMDPKGELFRRTAHLFEQVFVLNLEDAKFTDHWNCLADVFDNPLRAAEISNILVGFDPEIERKKEDPFWMIGEDNLARALLLFICEIADNPGLAHIKEFIGKRSIEEIGDEIKHSHNPEVQIAWGSFMHGDKEKLRGGIFAGLGFKLDLFRDPQLMQVMKTPTAEERGRGAREVDFRLLREKRTAIYLVIPSGSAPRYRLFLELFFALLSNALVKTWKEADDPKPVLVQLDEGGNIPLPGAASKFNMLREYGVAFSIGLQGIPQVWDKYGRDGGNALLTGIQNWIVLPGLDVESAAYFGRKLGRVTVLSRSEVDMEGTKNDQDRVTEAARPLIEDAEWRTLRKWKEAIGILDAEAPVRFRFPKLYADEVVNPTPRPVTDLPPLKMILKSSFLKALNTRKGKDKEKVKEAGVREEMREASLVELIEEEETEQFLDSQARPEKVESRVKSLGRMRETGAVTAEAAAQSGSSAAPQPPSPPPPQQRVRLLRKEPASKAPSGGSLPDEKH